MLNFENAEKYVRNAVVVCISKERGKEEGQRNAMAAENPAWLLESSAEWGCWYCCDISRYAQKSLWGNVKFLNMPNTTKQIRFSGDLLKEHISKHAARKRRSPTTAENPAEHLVMFTEWVVGIVVNIDR